MTPNQLRQAYLDFFSKKIDAKHAVIPSAALVPENDPTTLFTSSGMQPLVPYLLGQPHPSGTRLVDSQKSFRSQDIEEVGDNRHTTFFEMLGNWSLGEYFKKEQLRYFFTFLTEEVKLNPEKLFVTVFRGNEELGVARDDESVETWKQLFKEKNIDAKDIDFSERDGMQGGRIFYYPEKKNWWSRSGVPANMPAGEPGGPDSEVFYDFGVDLKLHENSVFAKDVCHLNCDCGRFLEIGNSVFMQFQKQADGSFQELPQKNVDFGGGFERIMAVMHDQQDVFLTPIFQPILEAIESVTGRKYAEHKAEFRVIADHWRAAVMLIQDGVRPSNKEQGYFLRRLIRRSLVNLQKLQNNSGNNSEISELIEKLTEEVLKLYDGVYVSLENDLVPIKRVLIDESLKFIESLERGLRELGQKIAILKTKGEFKAESLELAKVAFDLYQSYGLPVDISWDELVAELPDLAFQPDYKIEFVNVFDKLRKDHADQSRTASAGMFKGGLADHSEQTTAYHTATHLLHAALRKILGTHVQQKGSNITGERLRFDFTHPQAVTGEELNAVEKQINEWIAADLPVTNATMPKAEALAKGAMAFFVEKYPDQVSVYTIGKDPEHDWVSKELCGGPHVTHTGEIGQIELFKEQAVSQGVRRVYARVKK
jgi:alanyl-tRNA synthetase